MPSPSPTMWKEAVARYRMERSLGYSRPWKDADVKLHNLKPYFQGLPLEQITGERVQQFVIERKRKGVGNATINRDLEVLRFILRKAHREWKCLPELPVIRLLKQATRRVRFLSREEADRLIHFLPPELEAPVKFTLATGLRLSNVSNLRWDQVDLTRHVCWVHADEHKTGKALGIPLNRDAAVVLRSQVGRDLTLVFGSRRAPLNGRPWRAALRRAGLSDFRWHDLRHTWASWHAQAGTPLHVLQELGGWASIKMVQRYAHLTAANLAAYAERVSGPREVSPSPTCDVKHT